MPVRLEIGAAYTHALGMHEDGLDRLVAYAPAIVRIRDSFGTNSHFVLAILAFVDGLVIGVIGDP